jgi:hypothetical protein
MYLFVFPSPVLSCASLPNPSKFVVVVVRLCGERLRLIGGKLYNLFLLPAFGLPTKTKFR